MAARRTTSVRYPQPMLDLAETLARYLQVHPPSGSEPGTRYTRSTVLLRALDLGLRQMEIEFLQRAVKAADEARSVEQSTQKGGPS